ncbi:TPA: hypothetical protein ACSP0P_004406, partial [Citrobacter freundii]
QIPLSPPKHRLNPIDLYLFQLKLYLFSMPFITGLLGIVLVCIGQTRSYTSYHLASIPGRALPACHSFCDFSRSVAL